MTGDPARALLACFWVRIHVDLCYAQLGVRAYKAPARPAFILFREILMLNQQLITTSGKR